MKKIPVIIVLFLQVFFLGCGAKNRVETRTRVMFDTIVRVTLICDSNTNCTRIFNLVFAELEEWENALNAYDSASALFKLNESTGRTVVCEKLAKALKMGLNAKKISENKFDICIGNIVALWDFGGKCHVPSRNELDSALALSKNSISIIGDTVFKEHMAPRIDLGGCAKGIALDEVCSILDTIVGLRRYLIDLGGNIRGKDVSGNPFKIGIQDPRKADMIAGTFELLPGKACATSGDYQRFFVRDGIRYHHLLDPSDGMPVRKCSAVTVIAPNGYLADVFSTALFVMGPKVGMEFVEKSNFNIEAVFFDTDGKCISGNLKTK